MSRATEYTNIIWRVNERERVGYNSEDAYKEIAAFSFCYAQMIPEDPAAEPDLIRVQVNPWGKFDIVDFTTARRSGRLLYQNVPQEDVPTWIVEAVSMLRITDDGSVVQSVGFKVNDKLYYIVDRRDENEKVSNCTSTNRFACGL